jgi:hypothetical protein
MEQLQSFAYLAGVARGDAWCTKTFGLRCNDRDFSRQFVRTIRAAFSVSVKSARDERGYWLARVGNKTGRFNAVLTFEATCALTTGAWLRGLFDSEGNAQLCKLRRGESSYSRRVAFYSTRRETLEIAVRYLDDLGIPTILRATKNSATHKGTKVVHELVVRASRANYSRFADLVGSSIRRKTDALQAIVATYHPDLSAARRASQRLGAAAKHRKLIRDTLPRVICGIRALIESGVKPTQRACYSIPGFSSIQRYFPQSELVKKANEVSRS